MDEERQIPVRKSAPVDQGQERDLNGATEAERWAMMWPLTVSAWAMKGVDLRGSRLQRHVERLVKRKAAESPGQ